MKTITDQSPWTVSIFVDMLDLLVRLFSKKGAANDFSRNSYVVDSHVADETLPPSTSSSCLEDESPSVAIDKTEEIPVLDTEPTLKFDNELGVYHIGSYLYDYDLEDKEYIETYIKNRELTTTEYNLNLNDRSRGRYPITIRKIKHSK